MDSHAVRDSHSEKVNLMRKYALVVMLALAATLTLAACSGSGSDAAKQQNNQQQKVQKPSDPDDKAAWNEYLSQVLNNNLGDANPNNMYAYMVPGSDSDSDKDKRSRQLSNVSTIIGRGIQPGNVIAVGGPDSKVTADFAKKALKASKKGAMQGVTFMFIGDPSEKGEVADAVKPTGADFKFVKM